MFSQPAGERRSLALAWTGASDVPHWSGAAADVTFFDLKGAVERVCRALRVEAPTTVSHVEPWLVPARRRRSLSGGAAHRRARPPRRALWPNVTGCRATMPCSSPTSISTPPTRRPTARDVHVVPLPRFPSVTRDVAVLVSDTLPAAALRATVRRAAPPSLADVREFDRYQGKGVPEGKVSLALRLTFRAADRTLTDGEVQAAMDAVARRAGRRSTAPFSASEVTLARSRIAVARAHF